MHNIDNIREIFKRYGGMMRTNELSKEKLYYFSIQKLLEDGYIEKVRFGYYRWAENTESNEVDIVTKLFPDGILCMDTALHFYGYCDTVPNEWHIAVSKDSGKSRFNLDYPFVKPYYIEPSLLDLGVITEKMDGVEIKIFDRERVICDCLRYRNRMDKDLFNKAIKSYINDPDRNISHLNEYAMQLRVSKKARDLLAIWL